MNQKVDDFDINEYSTTLNIKNIDKKEIDEAEKQAKDILNSTHLNKNRHILEEWNLIELKDNENEE